MPNIMQGLWAALGKGYSPFWGQKCCFGKAKTQVLHGGLGYRLRCVDQEEAGGVEVSSSG